MNNQFITGSEYERLMNDFLNMGGDPKSCPFDTDDKKYEGPRIEDGEIVPQIKGRTTTKPTRTKGHTTQAGST